VRGNVLFGHSFGFLCFSSWFVINLLFTYGLIFFKQMQLRYCVFADFGDILIRFYSARRIEDNKLPYRQNAFRVLVTGKVNFDTDIINMHLFN